MKTSTIIIRVLRVIFMSIALMWITKSFDPKDAGFYQCIVMAILTDLLVSFVFKLALKKNG
jgi:hypothetical protein